MIDLFLQSKIEEECFLYYDSNHKLIIENGFDSKEWNFFIKKVCLENEKGIVSLGFECLYEDRMNYIIDCIKKYNVNFKLHSSSITPHEFTVSPYTNIALLHATSFIYDVDILKRNYSIDFDKKTIYGLEKHIFHYKEKFNKNKKYIFSARRWNLTREKIFNNLNIKNPTGIIRYLNFDNPTHNNKNELSLYKDTKILLDEYDSSYISFISETCVDSNRTMGYFIPMTEKTLLAFKFKTIPIIFGCRGLNNLLLNMGFWTANDFFGFDDSSDDAEHSFVEIVHKIDSMEVYEIEKLYINNLDKIENNYKLLNYLFDIGRKHNKEYQ